LVEDSIRLKNEISGLMKFVSSATAGAVIDRATLEALQDQLLRLAVHVNLFSEENFPAPTSKEIAKTYLLAENPDAGAALYLVSILPFGPSPIHDHGTFAIIAGLSGFEHNTVYTRAKNESGAGKATLEVNRTLELGPLDALALMPKDIHHIDNQHSLPTRHLHLYGTAFEHQLDRLEFDITQQTAKVAPAMTVPVDRSRQVV
jgi:predicted metal-dependent enzyme (double-stranded beta helix superfamily)